MRALVCALLLASATTAAADGSGGIAVLTSGRDRRREAVLVDALRIYTRDLGRTVRVAGAAPPSLEPDAVGAIAEQARTDGDDVVVWFGVRDAAPVLLALRVSTRELRETAVERDEPLRTARTLALKVRALLTTEAPRDWSVPPEASAIRQPATTTPAPEVTATAPATAATAQQQQQQTRRQTQPSQTQPSQTQPSQAQPSQAQPSQTQPSPTQASQTQSPPTQSSPTQSSPTQSSPTQASQTQSSPTQASPTQPSPTQASPTQPSQTQAQRAPSPPVATVARPAPRAAGDRVELHAEYGVVVPTEPTWLRHGLTVRVAVPLGRRPLALFADAAFLTAPSTTLDGSRVAARVWPVAVGAALRLRRPRWQLAAGPRASLQIVDADVHAADGRVAATRLYSAGLGLLGDARWLAARNVALVASVTIEALLPRLALAAGGRGTTDLGWMQLGVSAGVVFSAP